MAKKKKTLKRNTKKKIKKPVKTSGSINYKSFVALRENVVLNVLPDNKGALLILRDSKKKAIDLIYVNNSTAKILEKCDGTSTLDSIIKSVAGKDYQNMLKSISPFFMKILVKGYIYCYNSQKHVKINVNKNIIEEYTKRRNLASAVPMYTSSTGNYCYGCSICATCAACLADGPIPDLEGFGIEALFGLVKLAGDGDTTDDEGDTADETVPGTGPTRDCDSYYCEGGYCHDDYGTQDCPDPFCDEYCQGNYCYDDYEGSGGKRCDDNYCPSSYCPDEHHIGEGGDDTGFCDSQYCISQYCRDDYGTQNCPDPFCDEYCQGNYCYDDYNASGGRTCDNGYCPLSYCPDEHHIRTPPKKPQSSPSKKTHKRHLHK